MDLMGKRLRALMKKLRTHGALRVEKAAAAQRIIYCLTSSGEPRELLGRDRLILLDC